MSTPQSQKHVYVFSAQKTDGDKSQKFLLGGKGANLAEMCRLGIPVPPGFTISTNACSLYNKNKHIPEHLMQEILETVSYLERTQGKKMGDRFDPLLLSVRSGAAVSMPGMMDTILNLGLNDQTVEGMIQKTQNERFVLDSYRRFIHMFGTTVMEIEHRAFEDHLEQIKKHRNIKQDTDLTVPDLRQLVQDYKKIYKHIVKKPFPEDVIEQLRLSVEAVFGSWNSHKAIVYRKINNITGLEGTAVNVQTMVFGNMGQTSGTGVAFTRSPINGNNKIMGDFLFNAQGEDVVAGIRTPLSLDDFKAQDPKNYEQFINLCNKLEKHYKDMQDIEFTIQEGKLWFLQCRIGKRTAHAAIRIAVDLVNERIINQKQAILRIEASSLDQLLHPVITQASLKKAEKLGKALNASPGAATGIMAFTPADAKKFSEEGKKVILVRQETSPEDIEGMNIAQGILTARGGMTSHAAVVARGMGRPCVCGWDDMTECNEDQKYFRLKGGRTFRQGEWVTINGTTGEIFNGQLELEAPDVNSNIYFKTIMDWADAIRKLQIRTNADVPRDVKKAIELGAEGIGLVRTEHMFFKPDRIQQVRLMILSSSQKEKQKYIDNLFHFQKEDFIEIFKIMDGRPVTIRLLDPPLHEFLPNSKKEIDEIANIMGLTSQQIKDKINALHEVNPMLGHRGVRLGITNPEITLMQAEAIFEAAAEVAESKPEIMVPLVGFKKELENQKHLIEKQHRKTCKKYNQKIPYLFGTMIEVPRGAIQADQLAQDADFFSFGTNDLTQMTCGFSRDDSAKFLKAYNEKEIITSDPFQSLDQSGVGHLVELATNKGRSVKNQIKLGICGEHGGDPKSIYFCHQKGLNYVSCSPFRIPIARFAAAQAVLLYGYQIQSNEVMPKL